MEFGIFKTMLAVEQREAINIFLPSIFLSFLSFEYFCGIHLFISLHTVKSRPGGTNAYGKLGVSHRTEAVARANELKLL